MPSADVYRKIAAQLVDREVAGEKDAFALLLAMYFEAQAEIADLRLRAADPKTGMPPPPGRPDASEMVIRAAVGGGYEMQLYDLATGRPKTERVSLHPVSVNPFPAAGMPISWGATAWTRRGEDPSAYLIIREAP